ncbi:Uncharacterized protein BM_BM17698 [Brugia malayi]|uniref:Uncharacterized protein n=1 Tax=Brugia malayi TaxID=6279 RepID=A0A4E9FKB6_BRUMA|nr:Uncharacterized protein BM_BM17698 [Brugia malayi]VIO97461.1 Uncharacterized protein BM_BM17698 [Brugia malayi]
MRYNLTISESYLPVCCSEIIKKLQLSKEAHGEKGRKCVEGRGVTVKQKSNKKQKANNIE